MGLSLKSATKSVSKAASKATKSVGKAISKTAKTAEKSVSGSLKDAGKIASSLSKGDLKGTAAAALGATGNIKDLLKDNVSNQLGLATGLAGSFGGSLGQAASNIDREGNKGISTYGDTAIDMGANALTGGSYGLAQGLAGSVANQGLAGFKGAALQGLGSYAGIDPNAMNFLQDVSEGNDLMSAATSYGRQVAGDQVGAYANDAANQALDATGLQGAAKNASSIYKIAKGDTLGAIAKKMGVPVQALAAANGIKDINKIAAGMNLKIPGMDNGVEDLSGPIGEGVGEAAYAKANEPWTMDRVLGNVKREAGKAFDSISGAVKKNPNVVNAGLGAVGAGLGYKLGKDSLEEQQKIIDAQIEGTKNVNALNQFKFDPTREQVYSLQDKFLQDRIAGGGMTAAEKQMRAEGDLRAARTAAAGRLAGVEQQARMGQGTTGAGSTLAASLAGAQSGANMQAESDRAVASEASQNLEKAYGTRVAAQENKAGTEMNLAQNRDTVGLNRQTILNEDRAAKIAVLRNKALAEQNAIAQAANLASGVLTGQPQQAQQQTQQTVTQQQQPQARPQPNIQVKANAAKKVAGAAPVNIPLSPEAKATTGILAPVPGQKYADILNKTLTNPMGTVQNQIKTQAKKKITKALPKPVQQAADNFMSGFNLDSLFGKK